MSPDTAYRYQLRIQLRALAAALHRPGADPREIWRLADAALDTHDASGSEMHELRSEVVWLMCQIAARREVDAARCAATLLVHAASIRTAPPRFEGRRALEAACAG